MSLGKYSSSKFQHQHSPIQDRMDEIDIDPYAPTIVEDLLQVCFCHFSWSYPSLL